MRLATPANWRHICCREAERVMVQVSSAVRPAVDPAPRPTPANLSDPPTRERLTPAAVDGIRRLSELWRLTSVEVCALLGDVSERTWFRMKKGDWSGALSQDALTRISASYRHLQGPSAALLGTPL